MLSDHGQATEGDAGADGESTATLPPLPLVSWLKETRISRHSKVRRGRFLKPRNSNDRRGAESPFFDCREEQEHSDLFAAIGPLGTVWTGVSVRCGGCSSVNFPAVCQKLVVYGQFVSIAASLCDISSGKECQPDTAPSEAAPCEDWLIGEVELNTLNDQQHLHRQQTCWNNW